MKIFQILCATVIIFTWPLTGLAWGPHSEITQAAMETLPPDSPLKKQLGNHFKKLRDYCWMGDWRRLIHREAGGWFYVDDYLLFPAMVTHRDHLCPDVKQTYEPYFRRALQALRTENGLNAARWVGAILHFTEDTGSPPHAGEIRGDVHSKMENWVNAKEIQLDGYVPQILGTTDDEAVAGFLKRMDGLIAFSKERAERANPFVLQGDRASTEPIVLESALETARVVADLLHTLGQLGEQVPADGTALNGTISSKAPQGLENLPAKVVLLGSMYSTLADASGHYEFRNLPAGSYTVGALRCGNGTPVAKVLLTPGKATMHDFKLSPDSAPGNMLRNGAFQLNWISENRADAWYPIKRRIDAPHWEGELVPVKPGVSYRLQVRWKNVPESQVHVNLLGKELFAKPATELKPLSPGEAELVFTATEEHAYAQVRIYAEESPGTAVEHISLSAVP